MSSLFFDVFYRPVWIFQKPSAHSHQVNLSFLYQFVSVFWFRDSSDTYDGYVYRLFDLLGLGNEVALSILELGGSTATYASRHA